MRTLIRHPALRVLFFSVLALALAALIVPVFRQLGLALDSFTAHEQSLHALRELEIWIESQGPTSLLRLLLTILMPMALFLAIGSSSLVTKTPMSQRPWQLLIPACSRTSTLILKSSRSLKILFFVLGLLLLPAVMLALRSLFPETQSLPTPAVGGVRFLVGAILLSLCLVGLFHGLLLRRLLSNMSAVSALLFVSILTTCLYALAYAPAFDSVAVVPNASWVSWDAGFVSLKNIARVSIRSSFMGTLIAVFLLSFFLASAAYFTRSICLGWGLLTGLLLAQSMDFPQMNDPLPGLEMKQMVLWSVLLLGAIFIPLLRQSRMKTSHVAH